MIVLETLSIHHHLVFQEKKRRLIIVFDRIFAPLVRVNCTMLLLMSKVPFSLGACSLLPHCSLLVPRSLASLLAVASLRLAIRVKGPSWILEASISTVNQASEREGQPFGWVNGQQDSSTVVRTYHYHTVLYYTVLYLVVQHCVRYVQT